MWSKWYKRGAAVAAILASVGLASSGWIGGEANAEVAEVSGATPRGGAEPRRETESPRAERQERTEDPRRGLLLEELEEREGRLVQQVDDRTIYTTLDPDLQRFAEELLSRYEVPDGAAVAINSRTGEILALAEHSQREPGRHVALSATAPAASIFKIVTAAALLEIAGLSPELETCYHGGSGGITEELLDPDPAADTRCASLASALGRSINVIFARLADRHLSQEQLERVARGFGFNTDLALELPLEQARVEVPDNRLERARFAAGFWHSHLSPLQAASIVQAVAQQGALLQPYLVDSVVDSSGNVVHEGAPRYLGRVCTPETARQLARMMVVTTTVGTARSSFRERDGRPVLPGIDVAGKTGTLHGQQPFRAYDWFVGFAPADDPEIAVAGLVVNDPQWRIKGHYVGRELLRHYFQQRRRSQRAPSNERP